MRRVFKIFNKAYLIGSHCNNYYFDAGKKQILLSTIEYDEQNIFTKLQ